MGRKKGPFSRIFRRKTFDEFSPLTTMELDKNFRKLLIENFCKNHFSEAVWQPYEPRIEFFAKFFTKKIFEQQNLKNWYQKFIRQFFVHRDRSTNAYTG